MKKSIIFIFAIAVMLVYSCKDDAKKTQDAQEVAEKSEESFSYNVDTVASLVNWYGYKIYESKESGHYGIINMKSGSFSAKGDSLESGIFVADMNTMSSKDIIDDEETKGKLDGHLKSADFIDVAQFPEAKFEVTGSKKLAEGDFNTEVSGNLTIKGVEKNLTFNANVEVTDSTFSINSEKFDVARKDFGIIYEGNGESIIKDNMSLQVVVKGTK